MVEWLNIAVAFVAIILVVLIWRWCCYKKQRGFPDEYPSRVENFQAEIARIQPTIVNHEIEIEGKKRGLLCHLPRRSDEISVQLDRSFGAADGCRREQMVKIRLQRFRAIAIGKIEFVRDMRGRRLGKGKQFGDELGSVSEISGCYASGLKKGEFEQ